jgi:hypothetical protein
MIKKTRFLILVSLFGSIAYNIPRFFEFQTTYEENLINGGLSNDSTVNGVSNSGTDTLIKLVQYFA